MLPHLKDRPLTLLRANAGIDGERFLQKNLPPSAPASVRRFEVWTETSNRDRRLRAGRRRRGPALLRATRTPSSCTRGSRASTSPTAPTRWRSTSTRRTTRVTLPWAALRMRETLDELGLEPMVKTSGKRGLHLYVPVERRYDFGDAARLRAWRSAGCAPRAHPDDLTVEMRKDDRGDRLLLDWSRAGRAQTLAAAVEPARAPRRHRVDAADVGRGQRGPRPDGVHADDRAGPPRPLGDAARRRPANSNARCAALDGSTASSSEDASPRSKHDRAAED